MDRDMVLKLSAQPAFLLYACARETTKYYRPFISRMGLTYTQYLTMLALWEYGQMNLKALGETLYLDSGTLTPVLKKLEKKGYITRERDSRDERNLVLKLTQKGVAFKDPVFEITKEMGAWEPLTWEQNAQLYGLLRRALERYGEKAREKD